MMTTTKTTPARIYRTDAARIIALRRRLTVAAEGEPQTTADVIHTLIAAWDCIDIVEMVLPILERKSKDGAGACMHDTWDTQQFTAARDAARAALAAADQRQPQAQEQAQEGEQ